MPQLSVVLCTHNPRRSYFDRAIASLRNQTLSRDAWELLVVDNASSPSVAEFLDLTWHPHARQLREDTLGLTPARRCGIQAANGEILVFVDDDNELSPDYLAEALRIGQACPQLGAWGGTIRGEFETQPASWQRPYLVYLAVKQVDEVRWSNDVNDWSSTPVGAGLCIRAEVAQRYLSDIALDPVRSMLDRRGGSLDGAGDIDMAYTSKLLGLGWGTFPTLQLTHLIPSGRTKDEYLLRLIAASTASMVVLGDRIGRQQPGITPAYMNAIRLLRLCLRNGLKQAPFYLARQRGIKAGYRKIETLRQENSKTSAFQG
ncbi:MAG: glycosyl transferase family 2 [Hyphomicrobiales bacterium]|nr:glycosyl transferase family 2 [Hyphomicrobiales bacterium]